MWILTALIVGGICGWLASILMKTRGLSVLGTVAIGVLGSFLGQWLFGVLGFAAYGLVARLVVNVAGAMALIALLRALKLLR